MQGTSNKKTIALIAILSVCVMLSIASLVAIMTIGFGNLDMQGESSDVYELTDEDRILIDDTIQGFATGILTYSYVDDEKDSQAGKNAAMSLMTDSSDSRSEIENMSSTDSGSVRSENLSVVMGVPNVKNSVMVQDVPKVEYSFTATVADKSTADEEHPDGYSVDDGYDFDLELVKVPDVSTGTEVWVVNECDIHPVSAKVESE